MHNETETNYPNIEIQAQEVLEKLGSKWRFSCVYQTPDNDQLNTFKQENAHITWILNDIPLNKAQPGEHLVSFIEGSSNWGPNLSPADIYKLARCVLAENDLILGDFPVIYDKQNTPAEILSLKTVLNLCEKTSAVWALDLMYKNFPDMVEELLFKLAANELNVLEEVFHHSDISDQFEILQSFLDAGFYVALLTRRYKFVNDESLIQGVSEMFDSPDSNKYYIMMKRINALYIHLPVMPKNPETAVRKMVSVTNRHGILASLGEVNTNEISVISVTNTLNTNHHYYAWRPIKSRFTGLN